MTIGMQLDELPRAVARLRNNPREEAACGVTCRIVKAHTVTDRRRHWVTITHAAGIPKDKVSVYGSDETAVAAQANRAQSLPQPFP
ncbi:hypothetical protein GCM10027022_15280 [Alpinimonas psychrophila]